MYRQVISTVLLQRKHMDELVAGKATMYIEVDCTYSPLALEPNPNKSNVYCALSF